MRPHFLPRFIAFCLLCIAWTIPLYAHGGRPDSPKEVWRTWGWEPLAIAGLIISGSLFFRGSSVLRRATRGRGTYKKEAVAYTCGWLALWVALVSPLHPLGRVLFSAHMTQHEVLMLVAAPLLVLGRPLIPCLWSLPMAYRQRIRDWTKVSWVQRGWQFFTNPFIAWAVHALALWIWHAPYLFQATLENEFVHTLQHLSFLLSALLFWWALIHGRQGAREYGAAVLYLFTTSVHSGALGALITFSNSLWYPAYSASTSSWGLTAIEDQQLGGLIMWIPAALVYVFAGLAMFAGWLRESERRVSKVHANAPH